MSPTSDPDSLLNGPPRQINQVFCFLNALPQTLGRIPCLSSCVFFRKPPKWLCSCCCFPLKATTKGGYPPKKTANRPSDSLAGHRNPTPAPAPRAWRGARGSPSAPACRPRSGACRSPPSSSLQTRKRKPNMARSSEPNGASWGLPLKGKNRDTK